MVHFSNSFYAFLQNERAKGSVVARLIVQTLGLGEYYPAYKKLLTTEEVNYITMRTDGLVSYLPAGKEHKTNERGEWAREGRQSGKPAKVIRKIFTEQALKHIKAQEFEQFGNAYKAKFVDNGYKFVLRPHGDIPDVYCMAKAPGEGPLSQSCMNGDRDYLEIYKNCKALQILTLVNKEDRLCGRALVWSLNHDQHGPITFMDRIYVVEDFMCDIFLNEAESKGWWRKSRYTSFEQKADWVNPKTGSAETMHVVVETPTNFDYYPYIDTMGYGDDGFLTNRSSGYRYAYNETSGSREGDPDNEEDNHEGQAYDDINEEYIHDDDCVYLSEYRGRQRYRGMCTHRDNTVRVLVSGRDGTSRFSSNDGSWEYLHQDDNDCYVEIQVNGRWTNYSTDHDDIVYTADGEYDHVNNCVTCETDGEWYKDSDPDLLCSDEGKYYHKYDDDDCVYVETDKSFHYLPECIGEVVKATNGTYYLSHDERITQVVDDEDSAWFVIATDSPRMIVNVNGDWHHRADVADVTVVNCNDKGERWTTTVHYLQTDPRIAFVEAIIGKNKHKELGWFLKEDLTKFRNKYYRRDDVRMIARLNKLITPTKRKRATA